LLFVDLPLDKLLDIWVIDIEANHLCRAPGRATALNCAGAPVAHFQE
jgi:hypothetical protein